MAYVSGHGSSIAFTTSGFVAPIRSIGSTVYNRGVVEVATLAMERMTYVPMGYSTVDPFDLEYLLDITAADYSTLFPDIDAAAETVTISYPLDPGDSVPAKLTGTAFWTSAGMPELVSDTVMVGTASVQWEGGDDEPVLSEATA